MVKTRVNKTKSVVVDNNMDFLDDVEIDDDEDDEEDIKDIKDFDNENELSFDNENDFFEDYGQNNETALSKHNDLLKQLTNFDGFMKTMVTEWLGLVWSDEHKQYVEDTHAKPIMNVKCARWCINFMRVYTRDNNVLTNLDEDSYKWFVWDMIDTVYCNIGTRTEEFNIKEDGDVLLICNQLIHASQLVLIGAAGNKSFHDLLTVVTNRSENITSGQNSLGMNNFGNGFGAMPQPVQKQGFFQRLNPKNWIKT